MTHSETLSKLAEALCNFQQEITGVAKNAVNPFYNKSKYANLAAIWETIREPLTKHGLSVIQLPGTTSPEMITLTTMVLHTSGEWIKDTYSQALMVKEKGGIKLQNDPQSAGSAITYARRYALAAALGIHQEDDDAQTHNKLGKTAKPGSDELEANKAELHKAEIQANESGLFTADELQKFNKEYVGSAKVADAKNADRVGKAAVRFDMWALQRRVSRLAEELLTEPNHLPNYYKKHLEADDPYACTDRGVLDAAWLDLQDRKDKLAEAKQEAV